MGTPFRQSIIAHCCRCSFAPSSLVLLLLLGGWVNANSQDKNPAVPSRPGNMVTIQGRVSLSDGRPAPRVLVRLTTRGGVPREAFTNDQGRFEFTSMEEGGYVLTASSLADPNLIADAVETDTSRTATGTLNVSLTLHSTSDRINKLKPGVIRVGESAQKVPKDARKAFERGLKLKENNESAKALDSLSRAIELFPEYFQALTERGDLYVLQRKLTEAAADFARALKINDRDGPALRGSGYCKLEKKEFVQAVGDFERSISVEPDNANTYLLLGIANLELDRREPAREALQKALSFSNHTMPRAHIYLANLYALEHHYVEAADEIHKYLDADPGSADAGEMRKLEAQWRARAAVPHLIPPD